jgi:hypothetical protein
MGTGSFEWTVVSAEGGALAGQAGPPYIAS